MRWITSFGMLHLSGVYYIFLFAIAYSGVIHNILVILTLALITAIIFDWIVSIIYGLRLVDERDHYSIKFDGKIPDCHGLFATACISAVVWYLSDSIIVSIILPIIIVFIGKQVIWNIHKKN